MIYSNLRFGFVSAWSHSIGGFYSMLPIISVIPIQIVSKIFQMISFSLIIERNPIGGTSLEFHAYLKTSALRCKLNSLSCIPYFSYTRKVHDPLQSICNPLNSFSEIESGISWFQYFSVILCYILGELHLLTLIGYSKTFSSFPLIFILPQEFLDSSVFLPTRCT